MSRIAVFSGTREGHKLIKMLCEQEMLVTAFVGNNCEELILEPSPCLKIMKGNLSKQGMEDILAKFTLVIDATYPAEAEISNTLQEVSKKKSIPLLRVNRKRDLDCDGIYVDSVEQAVQYLNEHEGNVMLSMGVKELGKFSRIENFHERVCVRIAPTIEELLACNMTGFLGKQIIAMEGSISNELTHAQMREFKVKYLVMKEKDLNNMPDEEVETFHKTDEMLIVVRSLGTNNGTSAEETLKLARQFLGLTDIRKGIGENGEHEFKGYFTKSGGDESSEGTLGSHRKAY